MDNTRNESRAAIESTPLLAPCPFCKTNPVHLSIDEYCDDQWHVLCGVCGARGPHCTTKQIATEYWNRANAHALAEERSDDSQQRVVGSSELKGGEA
jgi:peroxiredoxin